MPAGLKHGCPVHYELVGTGLCPSPWECSTCSLLQETIQDDGGVFIWVCGFCLPDVEEVYVKLGFYTSGECDCCGRQSSVLRLCRFGRQGLTWMGRKVDRDG